jgi:hypothetical protein
MLNSLSKWLAIAVSWAVVKRSLKVSLIVGTLLAVINHGDTLFMGFLTSEQGVKILFTYWVPYGVLALPPYRR